MGVKNETGNCYGRLTVLNRETNDAKGNARWLCKCECGKTTIVLGSSLRNGHTQSCGCLHSDSAKKIGLNNKKQNKYDLTKKYGIGYTSKNEEFYFDLEDYDLIKNYCWYITTQGYLCCKREENILMHRLIMGNPKNYIIDHINHITYDNRKQNLRLASYSQNQMNKEKSNSSSGVCGVYWYSKLQKWSAELVKDGIKYNLGLYKDLEEAIKARKEAEAKYFKEFAYKGRGDASYDN